MSTKKNVELLNIQGTCYSVDIEPAGSGPARYRLKTSPTDAEDDKTVQFPPNLIVIDSIHSGRGRTTEGDFYDTVIQPVFQVLNVQHRLVRTTSRDTIAAYARALEVSRPHTVLFLSGDTSISEFINSVPKSAESADLSILPFPMGSGNAWASSLGIMCPAKTLGQFITGKLSHNPFPLYRAVFPNGYSIIFFIILSMGFHANLIHACERPEYQNMGLEKFQKAANDILDEYDLDLKISVGNRSGSYSYFALINTSNLEPTYRPSPDSDALKEELHLLAYSSRLTREQLLGKIMKGYELGSHSKLPLDDDTTYLPLTKGFDITLDFPPLESPRYKSEICCDGVLLNLLDLQAENGVSNKIKIEFLSDCSDLKLKAFSAK